MPTYLTLRVRFLVVALTLGLAWLALAESASASDLTVTTTDGAVEGTLGPSGKEWRGVPYAAPPVGDLRWQPPADVTPWSGVRAATSFAPPCIQLNSPSTTIGSEDCLYLNVFVPPTAAADSNLPVMVHLHPGGNSGFRPYTNAKAFVERGVAVVTVGYRLGMLGWAGHPALSEEGGGSSGEYGALDQIAALRWVRDNIAAFGGDPGMVTLFGDSAGSFDATAIIASPLSEGLVQRAALQTESWWALNGVETIDDAEQLGIEAADFFDCSDVPDVADCLRAVPADALTVAAGPLDIAPWVGGKVLPRPPLELLSEQGESVPLLVGSNREEASNGFGFGEFVQGDAPYRNSFYFRDTNAIAGANRGAEVRRQYPVEAYDSALWATVAVFSDAIYTCPMRRLAHAAHGPVWRYLYAHTYQNSEFLAGFRAGHFIDDPLLWHDMDLLSGFGESSYELTPDEEALSANMTTYWTNFAKTGDPNGSGLPSWPQYDQVDEPILTLGGDGNVIHRYHRPQCALLDSVETLFPDPWHRAFGPGGLPPGFERQGAGT
jgi:para-nitrobenzyl esterase